MNSIANKAQVPITLLSLLALAVLVAAYYSPIWWVSLTAPNYPAEAFPDGVRIHFHMNGVFNGCKVLESEEVNDQIALDCVHEMDTINHFVGMYPIAAGGVIERTLSPFLMSLVGIMVLGFMCPRPGLRMGVMTLGFFVAASWMVMTFYGDDGLQYQNEGYLEAMVMALDQDMSDDDEDLSPAQALIERLKASLADSGEEVAEVEQPAESHNPKTQRILNLRTTFELDQRRHSREDQLEWNGSNSQLLAWHYEKNLGRWFNEPEVISPMVSSMSLAAHLVVWLVVGVMVLLVFGARKNSGLLYWALILAPMALPVLFIIEYSGWLWWYGHNMNEMGAFTLKPFMPTVLGDGKVAQFATHSYPSWGFALMVLFSLLTTVVALLRLNQQRNSA